MSEERRGGHSAVERHAIGHESHELAELHTFRAVVLAKFGCGDAGLLEREGVRLSAERIVGVVADRRWIREVFDAERERQRRRRVEHELEPLAGRLITGDWAVGDVGRVFGGKVRVVLAKLEQVLDGNDLNRIGVGIAAGNRRRTCKTTPVIRASVCVVVRRDAEVVDRFKEAPDVNGILSGQASALLEHILAVLCVRRDRVRLVGFERSGRRIRKVAAEGRVDFGARDGEG